MDGLIQTDSTITQAGGRNHTDRAGNHTGLIRKNITKHILGYDDIKLRGIPDQLHSGIIHQHIAVFHLGVLLSHCIADLTPQLGGIQHIGLIDHSYFFAAFQCHLKGNMHQTLNLVRAVAHHIGSFLLAVYFLGDMLAKIHAADQLAHDHQINAALYDLGLQRRSKRQLLKHTGRTHIGIQPHSRTQPQQTTLGTQLARQSIPLIAADSTQQHTVAGQTSGDGILGQRYAVLVDRAAAHIHFFIYELMAEFAADSIQHFQCLVHDLRPDTVALDNSNILFHYTSHFPSVDLIQTILHQTTFIKIKLFSANCLQQII